ncbi:MAG: OPT/YSL family transporter [Myxococcaceae bacterium]
MTSPLAVEAVLPASARRELTFRSVAVALVVAALMGASYPLIVLKLGFGPNISVVSAFFGYLFLSAVGVFTGARANRLENNLVQTAGTTAGQAGFMCVLLAAFDMLNAKPELGFNIHLSVVQTFVWLTVAGLLGVLLAVPLRAHYIDHEKLAFADGVATGETLTVLEDPTKARSRATVLGLGMLLSGAVTWLQVGFPAKMRLLPGALYFGTSGKALRLGMGWSLLSFGTGLLVGPRVTLSMGLGMLASWVILPPLLFEAHAIEGLSFGQTVRWVMWPATGVMVAGGLTALALKWRMVVKTFTSFRAAGIAGSTDFPIRWVAFGVLGLGAALCAVQYVSLGMPVWVTLVSLALSIPLMLVGIQVLGETNWAPVSVMANMMQGIFALLVPGHVPTNMIASGMSGTVAGNGEHLMQDYKAGQIVGASYRHLTYLQLMAVPVGSLAVALVYPVLRDRYGVVDMPGHAAELTSPISVKWAGFAELLAKGVGALPPGSGTALLIGCALGVLLAVGETTRHKRYCPSATGIGIGMLIPGSAVLPMVLGGLVQLVWGRRSKETEKAFSVPLASGFIAGEALVAVVLAIVAAVALASGVELQRH